MSVNDGFKHEVTNIGLITHSTGKTVADIRLKLIYYNNNVHYVYDTLQKECSLNVQYV
jgi:hypothetical protein